MDPYSDPTLDPTPLSQCFGPPGSGYGSDPLVRGTDPDPVPDPNSSINKQK
jgi:hypothetical protein